ncbi:MAG: DUF4870 domain-containing protein [Sedimentisphaerales bacterium]|jgi:hypothetical protein
MAKEDEVSEPAEKPESETPAEQEVSAEQKVEAKEPEVVEKEKTGKELDKDARMWAMICHLAGLAGLVVPVVGCVVGPLVVWQIKKEEFTFVNEQGKEAVNFQISMLIYGIVAGLLCFVCVGVVLLPAVAVFDLIFLLIASVKTNNGLHYRYPLTIRFIK